MGLFDFLFRTTNNDTTIKEEINIGEKYEQELYEIYGNCKPMPTFGLKILFITDTHNCLAYTDKYLNYLESINSSDYDLCIKRVGLFDVYRILQNFLITEHQQSLPLLIQGKGLLSQQAP